MSSIPPEDLHRITDYVIGGLDPTTRVDTERWIAADIHRIAMMDVLRRAHTAVQEANGASVDLERMVQRLRIAVSNAPSLVNRSGSDPLLKPRFFGGGSVMPLGKRSLRQVTSLSAAVAVAAIVGVVAARWGAHSARGAMVYTASSAEQKIITLPDGSAVRLAPQSKLIIVNGFGKRERAVELTGEAHFAVITGSGTPFLVHSAGITSRVLGTEFSVKHFDGDGTVQIAVVSGKVGSSGVRSAAITTAGKISNLTDSTAVTTDVHHQTAYTDWSRGQLIFNAAPVSDMLATLGRWYGYEFKWSDAALSAGRVSGTFNVADRADMMVVLSAVLDVTMTIHGKIITLQPRGAMHTAPVKSYEHFTSPSEIGR